MFTKAKSNQSINPSGIIAGADCRIYGPAGYFWRKPMTEAFPFLRVAYILDMT